MSEYKNPDLLDELLRNYTTPSDVEYVPRIMPGYIPLPPPPFVTDNIEANIVETVRQRVTEIFLDFED